MSKVKTIGLSVLMALFSIVGLASPVLAISLPDNPPTIESINAFRNVLESGDFLIVVYENTPYSVVPDIGYREAYIWRLIDTDGITEVAQALGYEYHADGYGYNVISFYLSAANFTSAGLAWGDALFLRLSGTPSAFATPPTYSFSIASGDYNSLTTQSDVQGAIADLIRTISATLNNAWNLTATYYLLDDTETAIVLSIYGQSFWRGAIYGVQAMAPSVFPLVIENINVTPTVWSQTYTQALAAQPMGTPLTDAFAAGRTLLDVNYNLFPMLILLVIIIVLMVGNWMVSGNGNLWKGAIESAAPLVIGTRIGMLGFGELGLIAALCWLYVSARIWRMI